MNLCFGLYCDCWVCVICFESLVFLFALWRVCFFFGLEYYLNVVKYRGINFKNL